MDRRCAWCLGPIADRARRDAKYCRVGCRQAAHRTTKIGAVDPAGRDGSPRRLAYADPPYLGKSRRYYGHEASYAGEVDHDELLGRLAEFDGWALSCSSASIPELLAIAARRNLAVRLAIWHRRPAPHPTAGLLTAYEGVIYSPARPVARGSAGPVQDVLTGVEARRRPTMPGAVIGMKPPRFSAWVFRLIGARPGDTLADLYPGSGMVGRAWAAYVSRAAAA